MRPALHALLHRFALAAVFALALVPTLGRVEQAFERAPPHAAPTGAMHHAGHAAPQHAGHAVSRHAEHASPKAPLPSPHHGDGDCAYCPLLQGLLTPGAVTAGPAIAPAPAAPSVRIMEARFDAPHPTGLGSRGPPIA